MATRLNDFNKAIRAALRRGEQDAAMELFRLKAGKMPLAEALIQAQPKLSTFTPPTVVGEPADLAAMNKAPAQAMGEPADLAAMNTLPLPPPIQSGNQAILNNMMNLPAGLSPEGIRRIQTQARAAQSTDPEDFGFATGGQRATVGP